MFASTCGVTSNGGLDLVRAWAQGMMTSSECGLTVYIDYKEKYYNGVIVGKCTGCDNQSIDVSRFALERLSIDSGDVRKSMRPKLNSRDFLRPSCLDSVISSESRECSLSVLYLHLMRTHKAHREGQCHRSTPTCPQIPGRVNVPCVVGSGSLSSSTLDFALAK